MGDIFQPLDLVIFFGTLVAAMVVGIIAGRKEETAEDYFLAGRKIRWWGVAGSIFGSNVSANHMVGMMGLGFSVGFAQSHFELGAIAGLMLLCYGFLPVYRKLKLYTLSEYLGRRYDARSRVSYAVIMVTLMAVVQLVPGLYIGGRSICVLMGDPAMETVEVVVDDGAEKDGAEKDGATATRQNVNRNYYAFFVIALAVVAASYTIFGGLKAVVITDVVQSVLMLVAGVVVAVLTFRQLGGWGEMMRLDELAGEAAKMKLYLPMDHEQLPWTGMFTGLMAMHFFYWGTNQFIVQRALGAASDREARIGIITAGFLKLLIPFFAIAAGVAAVYVFKQQLPDRTIDPDAAFPEMVKLVIAPIGFGVIGLIAAGLIGAILSSIDSMMNSAATIVTIDIYQRYINPDASDKQMIAVGRLSIVVFITAAALMAIFILNPNSEKNFFLQIADYSNYLTPGLLVAFGLGMLWRRGTPTAAFVVILGGIVFSWAVEYSYNEYVGTNRAVYEVIVVQERPAEIKNDDLPDKLKGASLDDKLAYVEQKKLAKDDDLPAELRGVSLDDKKAYVEQERKALVGTRRDVIRRFGPTLNFFHRVVIVLALCVVLYVAISLVTSVDPEKSKLTWTDLGGHDPRALKLLMLQVAGSIAIFIVLAVLMVQGKLDPYNAAILAAAWTFGLFLRGARASVARRRDEDPAASQSTAVLLLTEDRFWAGLLCGLAMFMMFYFY